MTSPSQSSFSESDSISIDPSVVNSNTHSKSASASPFPPSLASSGGSVSPKRARNIVAVDVGYGNTKMVCGRESDVSGRVHWKEAVFPSVAVSVMVDEASAGHQHPDRILIECKGKQFYAGPHATSGALARAFEAENYIETSRHEVLLRAALHMAMRESGRVMTEVDMLVLGLPVSGYVALMPRLRELALMPRRVPVPQSLGVDGGGARHVEVRVRDCLVMPQPFGALRHAANDLPGTDVVFQSESPVMVVDPGYRTLDWLVSEGLKVEFKLSGSYDGGASSILRGVSQKIGYDLGIGSIGFDAVERGLLSGSINLGNQSLDMRPYQKEASEMVAQEVAELVARVGGLRHNVAKVLITGGAARWYSQAIGNHWKRVDVVTLADPVMSNARGFWLSGCDALG